MLYAIGEIVLVVIGILIALQINNWNQQRLIESQERIYLEDIKRDFTFDIETLDKKLAQNETAIESVSEVLTLISSKRDFSDEDKVKFYLLMTPLFGESYFIPEQGTINQIEASGAGSYIQNKALKDEIFRYYSSREREEKNMEQSVQLYQHNYVSTNLLSVGIDPAFSELAFNDRYDFEPIDISLLLKDKLFTNALFFKTTMSARQNSVYQSVQLEAERIIALINDELSP